jgi:DNA polymerase-4
MQTPQTYIAHFDLDTFFVSVAILNDPSLKGKPVIIGGSKERGVVSTCSYEARKFGVKSAMPMKQAMQLCPHAIVTHGTRGQYSKYSTWVTNIIASKAPLFEKASIDEFYIDLTGMDKFFDVLDWTKKLREQIIDETQLPISFGLASNKMIAKIATDEAKPNGFLFVPPGKEKEFLAPLPVNKFSGVGEHTFLKLKSMGINLIGDLLNHSEHYLEKELGKWGKDLYKKAQGINYSQVHTYREQKSISTENTFEENISSQTELIKQLVRMTEKVGYELRQEQKLTACVAVKIRYPNFDTVSKQTIIASTCNDDEIIVAAKELFTKLWQKNKPVRLLGVRVSNLNNNLQQGDLFIEKTKKTNLYKAIDQVKNRFGKASLQKARTVEK